VAARAPVVPPRSPHGAPVELRGGLHAALATVRAALLVSHGDRRMRGRTRLKGLSDAEGPHATNGSLGNWGRAWGPLGRAHRCEIDSSVNPATVLGVGDTPRLRQVAGHRIRGCLPRSGLSRYRGAVPRIVHRIVSADGVQHESIKQAAADVLASMATRLADWGPPMWMIFTRAPHLDALYWPGRRLLAAMDAVAWPAMWVVLVFNARASMGILGWVSIAWVSWAGVKRLRRAVIENHRYRFTTWVWGRVVFGLIVFGATLKLAASF
jgi:hypothetical protein